MKKILIIKHGSLGDIIFALPALASIREAYDDAQIYILTENKYINFFKRWNIFDFFFEDNREEHFFKSLYKLFKLRNIQFDLIIDLQNSQRTSLYNLFFRIFHSAKICSSRSFAHYRYLIPTQGTESATSGLLGQLSLIGIKKIENQNYNWLKIEMKEKYNQPLALFIPGASKKADYKKWQSEKFAEIAKYYKNLGFIICVVGAHEDSKDVLPILNIGKSVVNKVDQSPPEVIYTLALQATIIISNDTGPGHIATLAKKNIILLANNNKISLANLGQGSHIYKILAPSVKNITVEEVIDFIKKNNLY